MGCISCCQFDLFLCFRASEETLVAFEGLLAAEPIVNARKVLSVVRTKKRQQKFLTGTTAFEICTLMNTIIVQTVTASTYCALQLLRQLLLGVKLREVLQEIA